MAKITEGSLQDYYKWPIRGKITSENSEFMIQTHDDGTQEVVFESETDKKHAKLLALIIMSKRRTGKTTREGD